MVKSKKKLIFLLFVILLILISGCKGKKDAKKAVEELRTGTEGIIVNFLPNNPPDVIHIDDTSNDFDIVLELKNRGAYPQPSEGGSITKPGPQGNVYLSGYDGNIISLSNNGKAEDISGLALEGKNIVNIYGGQDLLSFEGDVDTGNMNVEKIEQIFLATVCYKYETMAGASVCIDPNPYSTINEKKVCDVHDVVLSSQGAPIAITKIEEEAFGGKTQFKITIKNVGSGEVLKDDIMEKCNPKSDKKIEREDIDKVTLTEVGISNKGLVCGPFAEGNIKGGKGIIRLMNGEGSVICELPKAEYSETKSAYISPLLVRLEYGYRTTAQKKVQILKEGAGDSSSMPH